MHKRHEKGEEQQWHTGAEQAKKCVTTQHIAALPGTETIVLYAGWNISQQKARKIANNHQQRRDQDLNCDSVTPAPMAAVELTPPVTVLSKLST